MDKITPCHHITISVGEKMSRLNYGSAKIISVSREKDFIRVGPIYKPRNKTIHHGICVVRVVHFLLNISSLVSLIIMGKL